VLRPRIEVTGVVVVVLRPCQHHPVQHLRHPVLRVPAHDVVEVIRSARGRPARLAPRFREVVRDPQAAEERDLDRVGVAPCLLGAGPDLLDRPADGLRVDPDLEHRDVREPAG
jgi:hypothetical protein